MTEKGHSPSNHALSNHGIVDPAEVRWNLSPAELYEHAIRASEGVVSARGGLVCSTGEHTGRSPGDKFTVEESSSAADIGWGQVNRPISEAHFDALHRLMIEHYRGKRLYVRDMFAGGDAEVTVPVRIVTETAWASLFASQLFIKPPAGGTGSHRPRFTVLNAPTCLADPAKHGTATGTFVVIHFGKGLALIGGTAYAGEIKKSIFTILNYVYPKSGILSMHCSANIGSDGDVALFFGLSGTGKTTLSADADRRLIGDDEHGWSDRGVFNFEGGCYAKCIKLSIEKEPQIFKAVRFGTVLENVVIDPVTRSVDFDSDKLTENTRAAYPLDYIDNAVIPSVGGHPKNVIFLTCDAFGVLPPISKLTPDQAMYHFLSGYTAKVAGTEAGVTEPKATFSACFGEPFLPLPPERYANMLGEKLAKHGAQAWLVNTGWSGGGVGVGERMSLRYTRSMVRAALSGELDDVAYAPDPVFGVSIPKSCPDVPAEVLTPKSTWRDPADYDAKAAQLANLFQDNFKKFGGVSKTIAAAAPRT